MSNIKKIAVGHYRKIYNDKNYKNSYMFNFWETIAMVLIARCSLSQLALQFVNYYSLIAAYQKERTMHAKRGSTAVYRIIANFP
jgi:hypothetical protein